MMRKGSTAFEAFDFGCIYYKNCKVPLYSEQELEIMHVEDYKVLGLKSIVLVLASSPAPAVRLDFI